MIAAATEPLLGILKYVLLALLYLFFARVLWAVWSEVRGPQGGINVAGARRRRADRSDRRRTGAGRPAPLSRQARRASARRAGAATSGGSSYSSRS